MNNPNLKASDKKIYFLLLMPIILFLVVAYISSTQTSVTILGLRFSVIDDLLRILPLTFLFGIWPVLSLFISKNIENKQKRKKVIIFSIVELLATSVFIFIVAWLYVQEHGFGF